MKRLEKEEVLLLLISDLFGDSGVDSRLAALR